MRIAIFKPIEEVGETAKAVLENKWDEVLAEVADIIIFASKVANITEDNYIDDKLGKVISRKLNYCEKKTYDVKIWKFDKPKNSEFK